ncbi:DoxX family protein [Aeromicrobium stalagmiti]|uniref:DoxX family protein n=1 Tax=Aeromicrobium stalagmiti TaxID=2738988 RepID=UPI0015697D9E|nr:hypothetical protein [Aeromicrobium stalagmiti]NRQ50744.1 hypothetical protein [Aeromicrobium stalagmiti]
MTVRSAFRWLLGSALVLAGLSHLFWARDTFRAQVPDWLPLGVDFVIVASGVVEITLGIALILLVRQRVVVGWVVAAFFVAVFPGNINQLVTHTDAFGLDSDLSRWLRLPFQPLLVAWALWSTEAWRRRDELPSLPDVVGAVLRRP